MPVLQYALFTPPIARGSRLHRHTSCLKCTGRFCTSTTNIHSGSSQVSALLACFQRATTAYAHPFFVDREQRPFRLEGGPIQQRYLSGLCPP